MKRRIKIIKDRPAYGQDSIQHMIGMVVEAKIDPENGEAAVVTDKFDGQEGQIILQKSEYEIYTDPLQLMDLRRAKTLSLK